MKILIWDKNLILKNMGGPMGYLYNIHEYLCKNPSPYIDFYSDKISDKRNHAKHTGSSNFIVVCLKKLKHFLLGFKFFVFFFNVIDVYWRKRTLNQTEIALLSKYDYVHLHIISDIFNTFNSLKGINTKIILTTHTPSPLVDEIFSNFNYEWLLRYFPVFRSYFLKKEIRAYYRADYIIFPVPPAIEAYTNVSKIFAKNFDRLHKKFIFVPTAISNQTFVHVKSYLDKYDIPKSSFKVCFIGRHNVIKGYDTLKEIAKKVWKYDRNVYFIIGGSQKPIHGLIDKRWIELGWVDTSDLLQEVDAFILPNKETYYDLILLEVLRSGTPVILTSTGGNKYFLKFMNTGLFYYTYGNVQQAADQIIKLHNFKREDRLAYYGMKNAELFKKTSTLDRYIYNYTNAISQL
jgi:glycosyltransferase involved in cell wall biosynthesis